METLSESEVDEGLPLGVDDALVALRPQGVSRTGKPLPPSKEPFDTKGYAVFQRKSLESKREYLKNQWLDIAYIVLGKGKLFARSVTKKDYGRLVQLLMAAGISWDKVFPKDSPSSDKTLILNLFNGLPQEKVLRVIGEVPVPNNEPLQPPTEITVPKD